MTTVVSAFYPIRSKFPPTQYLEWAKKFLKLESPIVLFTEPGLGQTFQTLRTNNHPLYIVEKPFASLHAWVLYHDIWQKHSTMDHEIYHTPELYALWAEKAWFVEEAIQRNPFGTSHFFWCDIGAFRTPMTIVMQKTFPRKEGFPEDRILLCSVQPLEPSDWKREDGIVGNFRHVNRIVGGLWGGTAAACLRWRSAYEAQLIKYISVGRFVGKDQSIMLSAYLEDTSLARIVRPTTSQGDHWFFLEYALSDGGPPLETDTSYIRPLNPPLPPRISVAMMGGLGNQLFQIAAAWSHARRTGTRLCLLNKKEADGRPMYWDTAFHRFQHQRGSIHTGPSWWEPAPTVYASPPQPPSVGLQLRGYFQSPKYFSEYADELRTLFRPSAEVLTAVQDKYNYLLQHRERVVVVHARRGDYCSSQSQIEYHGPLPVSYYANALKQFPKDSLFVLVSDEPMWWMEVLHQIPTLHTSEFHILTETDELITFTLLQQFQMFCIANSSFSWWAAWMADAKTVLAPATWFGPKGPSSYEDMYCPHWNRIQFV